MAGGMIAKEERRPYDVVCADGIGDEVVRSRIAIRRAV